MNHLKTKGTTGEIDETEQFIEHHQYKLVTLGFIKPIA
jgi:hypothetical protein